MNDNRHDDGEPSAAVDDRVPISPQPDARAQRVASRRYMLLKGATRGAAIVAAATPIKTLASIPSVTSQGLLCTISGIQSGVISAKTSLPICGGKSPGYYKKLENWPNYPTTSYAPTGCPSFNQNTTFNSLFGASTSVGTGGLWHIMKTPPHNNPEFHWIVALLNAIAATPGGNVFPYDPREVLDLYASSQSADALEFFKKFMES